MDARLIGVLGEKRTGSDPNTVPSPQSHVSRGACPLCLREPALGRQLQRLISYLAH